MQQEGEDWELHTAAILERNLFEPPFGISAMWFLESFVSFSSFLLPTFNSKRVLWWQ